ncbi:MAG TPA: hypothetical protein VNV66_13645 [Pilimelia sp.]|nr:hypothetical protein [Pilimelia sp.]
MWPDPGARVLALNPEDQVLYEWFLAYDSRVLAGDFGLVSDRLNAPDGVNLMANTSVVALGFLLAPVTVALGAPVTFAVLALASLAGTAAAWYLLLARTLRLHRGAALVGGALCGFAPGMVSQNNSHLHMTVQFLVPVIVCLVIRMARAAEAGRGHGRRLYGSALGLAAAITVQVFIGEEVLFLTALSLAVFTLAYAAARPRYAWRVAPRFAAALLLAAVVSGAALAYPLWLQFAGPQGVANGVFSPHHFSADLASFVAISPQSIGGRPEAAALAPGVAEHNTFFGWLLLLAAGTATVCLLRRPVVRAATVTSLVMAGLALGPEIRLAGESTGWTGPYHLLLGLPLVDGALPTRFALALVPLLALVLALAVDRALASPQRTVRVCIPVAVVAALLPISPRPMVTASRQPLPEFITAGHWRQCAPPGSTLVPVPLPTPPKPWSMRWAAAAGAAFALPEGFFIGPYGENGTGAMGVYSQPTSNLLTKVAETGETPPIGDEERAQARRDVAHWRASCVVLTDDAPHAVQLRVTLEALFGPGQRVTDVWTWRVDGAGG